MKYELELEIEPVAEEFAFELLKDDVTTTWMDKQCFALLYVNASTAEEAGLAAVEFLLAKGVKPRGFSSDFVTRADIADRAGVSKPTANTWSKEPTFPGPIGHTRGPIWEWGDVYQWLRSHKEYDEGVEILTGKMRHYLTRNLCAPEQLSTPA